MSAAVVCSIGCTDPWNAAGLGLDIRALAECGAYPVTVVAGITAQDRAGVHADCATNAALLSAQLDALKGAGIAAYRIGALLDATTIDIVAEHVARADVPVIYDPVLAPSGGGTFATVDVTRAIVERLVPIVTLVTPNLAEAATLTQFAGAGPQPMEAAARHLVGLGARAALVKGGHTDDVDVVDVLVDEAGAVAYRAARLPGTLRGTGCLLAAAAAAACARGEPVRAAVEYGRSFVRRKFSERRERGGMYVAY